jgi:addiction module HigA family antidote
MSNRRKRRPTHPGAILREDVLPEAGVSQAELAEMLNVSRRTVGEILNERRPVTTDMAQRLARVFGTTPEFWLRLQQAVDIWETFEARKSEYTRIKPITSLKRAKPTATSSYTQR